MSAWALAPFTAEAIVVERAEWARAAQQYGWPTSPAAGVWYPIGWHFSFGGVDKGWFIHAGAPVKALAEEVIAELRNTVLPRLMHQAGRSPLTS